MTIGVSAPVTVTELATDRTGGVTRDFGQRLKGGSQPLKPKLRCIPLFQSDRIQRAEEQLVSNLGAFAPFSATISTIVGTLRSI